jgi:mRNA interferase MazF
MIRRGDVVWADLEPVRGREAHKRRPAVVVSNDRANAAAARHGRGVVIVVPITSSVTKVFPFQVRLAKGMGGLAMDSKAQAEQMRAVDVERLGSVIGSLPRSVVAQLDDALRLQLDLLDR